MLEHRFEEALRFTDLEDRFGRENAYIILRELERFEGVEEEWVSSLTREARFNYVFRLMSENVKHQTRH